MKKAAVLVAFIFANAGILFFTGCGGSTITSQNDEDILTSTEYRQAMRSTAGVADATLFGTETNSTELRSVKTRSIANHFAEVTLKKLEARAESPSFWVKSFDINTLASDIGKEYFKGIITHGFGGISKFILGKNIFKKNDPYLKEFDKIENQLKDISNKLDDLNKRTNAMIDMGRDRAKNDDQYKFYSMDVFSTIKDLLISKEINTFNDNFYSIYKSIHKDYYIEDNNTIDFHAICKAYKKDTNQNSLLSKYFLGNSSTTDIFKNIETILADDSASVNTLIHNISTLEDQTNKMIEEIRTSTDINMILAYQHVAAHLIERITFYGNLLLKIHYTLDFALRVSHQCHEYNKDIFSKMDAPSVTSRELYGFSSKDSVKDLYGNNEKLNQLITDFDTNYINNIVNPISRKLSHVITEGEFKSGNVVEAIFTPLHIELGDDFINVYDNGLPQCIPIVYKQEHDLSDIGNNGVSNLLQADCLIKSNTYNDSGRFTGVEYSQSVYQLYIPMYYAGNDHYEPSLYNIRLINSFGLTGDLNSTVLQKLEANKGIDWNTGASHATNNYYNDGSGNWFGRCSTCTDGGSGTTA